MIRPTVFALVFVLASLLQPPSTIAAGEPPAAADARPGSDAPAERTLYWVRHGQYDWREEADPEVGKALVPLGIAQARLVAARLRADGIEPDRFVASPMTRARETAWEMVRSFPGHEVEIEPSIRECTPPTRRADVMAEVDPVEARECAAANDRAFETFFRPAEGSPAHDVVVAHGNVIRRLVTRALGVDPEAWLGMSVGNCSLTVFRIAADGAVKVLAVGDVGHLPPEVRTGLDSEDRYLERPEPPAATDPESPRADS